MIALQQPILPTPTEADLWAWIYHMADGDIAFDLAYMMYAVDPLDIVIDEYGDMWSDEPLAAGLNTARDVLPDEYVRMAEWYWQYPEEEFAQMLFDRMTSHMPSTEWYIEPEEYTFYWLPMEGMGIELENMDMSEGWNSILPPLAPLLEAVEYKILEEYDDSLEVRDKGDWRARTAAANDLIQSLSQFENCIYDNVAMLLHWFWVGTGNTLFDYTNQEIADYGMEADWHDLDSAWEMQNEADDLLGEAFAGIQALEDDPILFHSLICNLRSRYLYHKSRDKEEEILDDNTIQWATPCLEGDRGITSTQANYQFLRLWRDNPAREHVLLRETD